MASAQEIYEQLLEDPNLDVGPNQTREEAAKIEAEYRARQYMNNVRALALANQPLKSDTPIKALLNYVQKEALQKVVVDPEESGGEDRPEVKNLPASDWDLPLRSTSTHPVHGNVFNFDNSRFATSDKKVTHQKTELVPNDVAGQAEFIPRRVSTSSTRKELWNKLPDSLKVFWNLVEGHVLNSHPEFTASGDTTKRLGQGGEANLQRYSGGIGIPGMRSQRTGKAAFDSLDDRKDSPDQNELRDAMMHSDILDEKVAKLDNAFDTFIQNLHETYVHEPDEFGNYQSAYINLDTLASGKAPESNVTLISNITPSWVPSVIESMVGNGDWRFTNNTIPNTNEDAEPDNQTKQHFIDLGISFSPKNDSEAKFADRMQNLHAKTYGDRDSAEQMYGPTGANLKQIMNKFHHLAAITRQHSKDDRKMVSLNNSIKENNATRAKAIDQLDWEVTGTAKIQEHEAYISNLRRVAALETAQFHVHAFNRALGELTKRKVLNPLALANNHNNFIRDAIQNGTLLTQDEDNRTQQRPVKPDEIDKFLVASGDGIEAYHPRFLENMAGPEATNDIIAGRVSELKDSLNELSRVDRNELVYTMLFNSASPEVLNYLSNRHKALENFGLWADEEPSYLGSELDEEAFNVIQTMDGERSNKSFEDFIDNEMDKIQISTLNNTRKDTEFGVGTDARTITPIDKPSKMDSLSKGTDYFSYDDSESQRRYKDQVTNDLHSEPRGLSSATDLFDAYTGQLITSSTSDAGDITLSEALPITQRKFSKVFRKRTRDNSLK